VRLSFVSSATRRPARLNWDRDSTAEEGQEQVLGEHALQEAEEGRGR